MKTPGELYASSSRAWQSLPELDYPFHGRDILVTARSRVCMHRKKIHISIVVVG